MGCRISLEYLLLPLSVAAISLLVLLAMQLAVKTGSSGQRGEVLVFCFGLGGTGLACYSVEEFCVCVFLCVYIYIYIYIYTHTHTHTHTYI